jgi:glutathione S-transferase
MATTAEPTGKFKVVYFAAYGRVETARIMLAMAGQDFEDFRYPISFGTPGDMSTVHRPEFDADQGAGKFDYGLNLIPVIEAGDFKLPQSKAIERYVAKKVGMFGSTLEEEGWVDAINEHMGDIGGAFAGKESDETWFKEALPAYMKKLEATLPGTSGFAVGDKVSLADVAIYRFIKDTQPPNDSKWDSDVLASYADCPKIKAIVATMDGHEKLQKWLKERPQSTVGG